VLINIQFLRFAAALLVVLYHAARHVEASGADPGWLFSLGHAVGFAGVDIFFVISGFIMVHTTRDQAGGEAAGTFLRRRVARIYSGYWPFFLLALALTAWIRPERLGEVGLVASATLWPTGERILPVSWTLTYEMIFYLGFTVLLLLRPANRYRWLAAALVAILAWSSWSFFVRDDWAPGRLETMGLAAAYLTSPFLAEFLAGAVAARWLQRRPTGAGWVFLLTGTALFLTGGWINVALFDGRIDLGYSTLYRVLAFGPASLLILVGLVRLEHRGRVAPEALSVALGGSSYALYLSHTLLFWALAHLGMHAMLQGRADVIVQAAWLLIAAGVVVLSWVHYRTIERSLDQRFRRWLGVAPGVSRNPRTAPPPAS
jgi:peptidoglycan/LPS O-acetylase OafA/YrhL